MPGSNESKVIIFTHFGNLKYGEDRIEFQQSLDEIKKEVKPIMESYFKCNLDANRIQLVYIYVDWAVKQMLQDLHTTKELEKLSKQMGDEGEEFELDLLVPAKVLVQENALMDLLRKVEEEVRIELKLGPNDYPKFIYVGLIRLVGILHNIATIKPELLKHLFGKNGVFGYDSPKFVEAAIRLARGDRPYLSIYPVIRIDADVVEIPPNTIDLLFGEFQKTARSDSYFLFSGDYGTIGGEEDTINDFAVRTHWFYPEGTMPADPRFRNGSFDVANEKCKVFLKDLSYLGAWQNVSSTMSKAMKTMYDAGIIKAPNNATHKQVISGAGLIMSKRAIESLPPFMNFGSLTTWIDDHNKRLLHEVMGDIPTSAIRSVEEAKFKQNRHPEGLDQTSIDWTPIYLQRLLRGIILHSYISDRNGFYISKVKKIKKDKAAQISKKDETQIKNELKRIGESTIEYVVECWGSDEFLGTKLHEFAVKFKDPKRISDLVEEISDDAIAYLRLLKDWPTFVQAIVDSPEIGNEWLYRNVE